MLRANYLESLGPELIHLQSQIIEDDLVFIDSHVTKCKAEVTAAEQELKIRLRKQDPVDLHTINVLFGAIELAKENLDRAEAFKDKYFATDLLTADTTRSIIAG